MLPEIVNHSFQILSKQTHWFFCIDFNYLWKMMFYKCCCHCFFLVKSYISCLFNQWRVIVIINQSWSERTSFIRTLAFHKSIKIVFLIEELCSGSLIFGKRSINLKKSFKFSNSYRFKFVKLLKVIFMRKQSENFSATRVSRYEQYLSCLSMECSFWHQTYNFFLIAKF